MDLFQEFDESNLIIWEEKILKELKGRPLNTLSKNINGIDIQPHYNHENTQDFPFVNKENNQFNIFHTFIINNKDLKDINKEILEGLQDGVNAIQIIGNISSYNDFKTLFDKVQFEILTLYFKSDNTEELNKYILQYSSENNAELDSLDIKILNQKEGSDKFVYNYINARNFHSEGANEIQEIAYSLIKTQELIKTKGKNNPKFVFEFALGNIFFHQITKLKVFRTLWAGLCKLNDLQNVETHIIAHPSNIFWGNNETTNNLLRSTTQNMSAYLGEADAISIFQNQTKNENEQNRHYTNVHHLLQYESFISQNIQALEGSYYLNHLAYQMAEKAWEEFKNIDKKGGYSSNIEYIRESIKDNKKDMIDMYENSQFVMVGENKYLSKNHEKSTLNFN